MSPSAVCSTRLHILGLGVAALLVDALRSFGLPSQGRMISRSPTVTRQLPRLLLTVAVPVGSSPAAPVQGRSSLRPSATTSHSFDLGLGGGLPLPTTAEALGNANWASTDTALAMAGTTGGVGLGAALADASEAAGVGASVPPPGFAQADTTTTQATQRMPLG
jgi:hypothetical protein